MTPEQLEAIEGIGPKTVEKISIAVNNYFSSLEGGTPAEAANIEASTENGGDGAGDGAGKDEVGPDSAGQSGDAAEISTAEDMGFESPSELVEEGQDLEAELLAGVENAPPATEAEVTTHGDRPEESEVPDEKL
jgi:N utilization substance protein A